MYALNIYLLLPLITSGLIFFSLICKNLIRDTVTISRARKGSVAKLNWKAARYKLSNTFFTRY
jgi:hypothetical protein